jgi:aldose 1-epimerase
MMKSFLIIGILPAVAGLVACGRSKNRFVAVRPEAFQAVVGGKPVALYSIGNSKGMRVQITNYGGKIVSILVPDRKGNLGDVVLGYETIDGYVKGAASMGATVGRVAGRISGGRFILDGVAYTLAKNAGPNHIHGGQKGYRFVVWTAEPVDGRTLRFSYFSPDGEEGYPGNLHVRVEFSVTEDQALRIEYSARTDKPTVVNLTNHAFFNLAGEGIGDVLDQVLWIDADRFTPMDSNSIPTGEIRSVQGTPFDFTRPTAIGDRINQPDDQLKFGGGYDHNFVLRKKPGQLAPAARLYDPQSGRRLEVLTTEPGIVVYTANSLTGQGQYVGKGGKPYGPRSAVCLETQHFPDSPNRPEFPSTELRPGETFSSVTVYKFSIQ